MLVLDSGVVLVVGGVVFGFVVGMVSSGLVVSVVVILGSELVDLVVGFCVVVIGSGVMAVVMVVVVLDF